MLQLLLERGVVADGSAALYAARRGDCSRLGEQRFGQGGLACTRLAEERHRPYTLDRMCHGPASSSLKFILPRHMAGVETARKISLRKSSRHTISATIAQTNIPAMV